MLAKAFKRSQSLHFFPKYSFAKGATFIQMIESFFDRAAVHTGIRTYRLVFYKKAENLVKCSIPLKGTPRPIKMATLETVFAYRCQQKTQNLPTKGGTRFAKKVDIE